MLGPAADLLLQPAVYPAGVAGLIQKAERRSDMNSDEAPGHFYVPAKY